ncbi:MAG: heme-binding protein, partial [Massilia sp.]|nr:heme-binding protein [Massilia sp.]
SKATTALSFKTSTKALSEQAKNDTALAERIAANPAFNARAGGVPILADGAIIGAIGVGGARGSDIDDACALAGLAQVQSRLR